MKNILITGTTSGIGEYLASMLKGDFSVLGCGRSKNNIEAIDFLRGDIRDDEFLSKLCEFKNNYDYVIINAGVGYFDEFKNIGVNENRETIETNLLYPILLIQKLLKKEKISNGIIFIGSIAGKKSLKFGASYAASKFGLRGFAMQLKNELKGIKVHIINPSIVETNFYRSSKVDISKHKKNSLEEIYSLIIGLIEGREKRFEIDL